MEKIFMRAKEKKTKHFIKISFYSALVGIISGLGAVVFRTLIAFFHNLFFNGTLSLAYDSNLHFVSRFGNYVIIIPVIGGIIVGYLIQRFSPEVKGHGVPEVMEAVIMREGKIRPIVSLIKILATAIGIGSGGSAGREGPIVQIGASFGSTLGQLFHLKPRDIIILVGAGAGGGIAATFNAPIAGILFTIELILPEFSTETFIPLAISSIVATNIARVFLGTEPAFIVPGYTLASSWEFPLYIILGILCGFIAIIFTNTLSKLEIWFERLRINKYFKPAIGGLIVGILSLFFMKWTGHYYLFGVGYSFITSVLTQENIPLIILLALIFAKIIATSFTLGSGGSGGIFASSLFIGTAGGAAFGIIVNNIFPSITAPPAAYALIGMAAVVAGTTGAVITAIVMAYELTRSYEIILPLMLCVITSRFIVAFLYKKTMYSEPLMRRGIHVHSGHEINVLSTVKVKNAMIKDAEYLYLSDNIKQAKKIISEKGIAKIPILNGEEHPVGILHTIDILSVDDNKKIDEFVTVKDFSIPESDSLLTALHQMEKLKTDVLAVVDKKGQFAGVLPANLLRKLYIKKREGLF
ncbi:MAG: chloride channel protein [Caldisericota bacterium]|nr:chloride channel protein [Caldisericota bacterium]